MNTPFRGGRAAIVAADSGSIRITRYESANLVTPLVEDIKTADLAGSTCVLTRTNDEALQVTGLLLKAGFPARLIRCPPGVSRSARGGTAHPGPAPTS